MGNDRVEVVIGARDEVTRVFNSIESKMQSTASKIKAAWLEIGAVIAATAWLQSAAKDAIEAEVAFNKLKIQVEQLGKSYTVGMAMAIESTSQYAMVQDEEVAAVLQRLVFLTGDVEKSTKNLTLAYDFAYLKGIDVAESSQLIGLAMTGNIERLGRIMPEFRNLDDLLGKNATNTQKAAYAMAVFDEKVAGAMGQMTLNERMVRDLTNAYANFKEGIGAVALRLGTFVYGTFNAVAAASLGMAAGIFKGMAAIGALTDKVGLTTGAYEKWTSEATAAAGAAWELVDKSDKLLKASRGVEEAQQKQTVATHGAAAALAVKIKAESDAADATKKHNEELKKQQEINDTARIGGLGERNTAIAGFYSDLARDMETMQRNSQDAWLNLAIEYSAKEADLHRLGIEDKVALDEWYVMKVAELTNKETLIAEQEAKRKVAGQKQAEQAIYNMKLQTFNLAAGLLRSLGSQSKEAAIAAIAIEKGLAMASVIVNAEAAKFQAMAIIPYPASLAAVGHIEMMRAISLGIIAASGIVEAASVSGGGASAGSAGGPPVNVQDVPTLGGSTPTPQTPQQVTIQVYALDPSSVNWDKLYEEEIGPAINRGGDRNVQIQNNAVAA